MSTPQQQQNLVVQVVLFESRTGSGSPPIEHGTVDCDIEARPAGPQPRYKIVVARLRSPPSPSLLCFFLSSKTRHRHDNKTQRRSSLQQGTPIGRAHSLTH